MLQKEAFFCDSKSIIIEPILTDSCGIFLKVSITVLHEYIDLEQPYISQFGWIFCYKTLDWSRFAQLAKIVS